MTSTAPRRSLADLDAPYRAAESRLTELLVAQSANDAERAERALELAAAYDALRALAAEMQLAAYAEPVPLAVAMMLRHAVAGLDENAGYWRRSAADWRAAEKRASMSQRIEVG